MCGSEKLRSIPYCLLHFANPVSNKYVFCTSIRKHHKKSPVVVCQQTTSLAMSNSMSNLKNKHSMCSDLDSKPTNTRIWRLESKSNLAYALRLNFLLPSRGANTSKAEKPNLNLRVCKGIRHLNDKIVFSKWTVSPAFHDNGRHES